MRSCLEYKRLSGNSIGDQSNETKLQLSKDPIEALLEQQLITLKNDAENVENKSSIKKDCLLQSIDLQRLRALVYRDTVRNEKNKSKPFVIVVYILWCFCIFLYS